MPLSFEEFTKHCNKIVSEAHDKPMPHTKLASAYQDYLAACDAFGCEMAITYQESPATGEKKLYLTEVRPKRYRPSQPHL